MCSACAVHVHLSARCVCAACALSCTLHCTCTHTAVPCTHTAVHTYAHALHTARAQLQRELDAKCREFTAEHASPVMRPRPTGWQRDSLAALPQPASDGLGRAQARAQAQALALPPPLSAVAAATRATAQAQAAAARLASRLQPLSALPPPAAPPHSLPLTRAIEGEAHAEGGNPPSSSATRLSELRERRTAAEAESQTWLKRAKVARSACAPVHGWLQPHVSRLQPHAPGCNPRVQAATPRTRLQPTYPGCSPVHPRSRAGGVRTILLMRP